MLHPNSKTDNTKAKPETCPPSIPRRKGYITRANGHLHDIGGVSRLMDNIFKTLESYGHACEDIYKFNKYKANRF
jgi:hypothetical protein